MIKKIPLFSLLSKELISLNFIFVLWNTVFPFISIPLGNEISSRPIATNLLLSAKMRSTKRIVKKPQSIVIPRAKATFGFFTANKIIPTINVDTLNKLIIAKTYVAFDMYFLIFSLCIFLCGGDGGDEQFADFTAFRKHILVFFLGYHVCVFE